MVRSVLALLLCNQKPLRTTHGHAEDHEDKKSPRHAARTAAYRMVGSTLDDSPILGEWGLGLAKLIGCLRREGLKLVSVRSRRIRDLHKATSRHLQLFGTIVPTACCVVLPVC